MFEAFAKWVFGWVIAVLLFGVFIGCGLTSCVDWLGGLR